jgi:hypothetical protein
MPRDKATTQKWDPQRTPSHGIWFLRSWHFALPEDGILVTKQVKETHLMYVPIKNCVVGWYN